MGFQIQVNKQQAPAVAGDFATANPRSSVVAPESGFVAGIGGVTVGKFAWIDQDGRTVHNHADGAEKPAGFVHRDQQALITEYLDEASMVIPVGMPVTVMRTGDYFATVVGSAATLGAGVYADYSNGDVVIGSVPVGASATGAIGATFTASADTDDTRLVVTAVTGLISVGDEVSGTGITAGTKIVSQVSGTTGGAGTYQLDASNTASAATVTAFGAVLNITAVASGILEIGDPVSGTGVPANAVIESQVSGAIGGVGVYTISVRATAYAASTTVTFTGGILTDWVVSEAAGVGELTVITK